MDIGKYSRFQTPKTTLSFSNFATPQLNPQSLYSSLASDSSHMDVSSELSSSSFVPPSSVLFSHKSSSLSFSSPSSLSTLESQTAISEVSKLPRMASNFAKQISDSIYQSPIPMIQNFTEYSYSSEKENRDEGSSILYYPINATHSVIIWPNKSSTGLEDLHPLSGSYVESIASIAGSNNTIIDPAAIDAEFSIFSNPQHVLMIFFYSIIILVSLTGNLLVCKVTFSNREMRTTTNLLIASLACSDILMTGKDSILKLRFEVYVLLLTH